MRTALFIFFVFASQTIFGQMEELSKWQFSGYQKFLNTSIFLPSENAPLPFPSEQFLLNDNLLHNRLKVKYFPSENWTINAELRSRIFWGDQVRFGMLLEGDYLEPINAGSDDFFDWSIGLQDSSGYALHTTLDRFFAEYSKGDWEIRLGRQRINWGIATTWNPNDIFNAYNFIDFDYEERPGSDALRIKRYLGFASSIEVAVNAFDSLEEATAAVLTKFHSGSYDFQILTGILNENTVLGLGWAGNLGNTSFKGEGSWFRSLKSNRQNVFAFTIGIDYTFASQLYINSSFLFNSAGSSNDTNTDLFSFQLSALNLYPYKYSFLNQYGYPISPLLNAGIIIVYSPNQSHPTFINPALTVSIAQNWDLDLIGQLFFQKETKYQAAVKAGYLRMKWSF